MKAREKTEQGKMSEIEEIKKPEEALMQMQTNEGLLAIMFPGTFSIRLAQRWERALIIRLIEPIREIINYHVDRTYQRNQKHQEQTPKPMEDKGRYGD